ncbi:hypothetical protein GRI43_08600 [Altererythrobacter luteolus]|uniref:Uncharacterized protein n=1 Tax=Pontixanthobacter luteolus TaxID=295089 RepID=A0A6I4UZL3_9SPHN|nr:hypothetical protein [Pontixanthobacter luteolus]MXP47439.1 hypothetical protein [Pontixanthobacter luteolus]
MISIYDQHTGLAQNLPTDLRDLIEGHLITAKENGLSDLTHIAVIDEGDTEEVIVQELGFSPLHNPLTGKRFGEPDFEPNWDWLEVHPDWFELIYTVGDSGFAFVLFVSRTDGLVSRLCGHFGRGRAGN